MKKLLIACLVLFTLTACGTKYTLVSNPEETIIEGENISYTKQDFFDDLQNNDFTPIVLSSILEEIANLEGLTEEEIVDQTNAEMDEMRASYGNQFPMMMNYYGGEEQFSKILSSNIITTYLTNSHFEANYEDLKATYAPVKAKLAYFDTLEAAQAALEQIENGTTLEIAAANNGYAAKVVESVYTDKSELPLEVKSFITTAVEPTTSKVILTTNTQTSNDGTINASERYYIVEVTNLDVDSFKDDFFKELLNLEDLDAIINTYIVKYNVEVHDQKTYKLLSSKYPGIK